MIGVNRDRELRIDMDIMLGSIGIKIVFKKFGFFKDFFDFFGFYFDFDCEFNKLCKLCLGEVFENDDDGGVWMLWMFFKFLLLMVYFWLLLLLLLVDVVRVLKIGDLVLRDLDGRLVFLRGWRMLVVFLWCVGCVCK